MDFNIIAPDKAGDAGIVWIFQDPENRLLNPAQKTFGSVGSRRGNWIFNFDFFATWVMGLMQHSIMKHLLLGRGNAGVIEVLEISPRQSTWTLFNFWNLLFWAWSRPGPKFLTWILNVKSGMQSFLKTSRHYQYHSQSNSPGKGDGKGDTKQVDTPGSISAKSALSHETDHNSG